MSDPVEGHYVLISTSDGGDWAPLPSDQMPKAREGETAFAASGTCLSPTPRTTRFWFLGRMAIMSSGLLTVGERGPLPK